MKRFFLLWLGMAGMMVSHPSPVIGQTLEPHSRALGAHILVPQSRAFHRPHPNGHAVQITKVDVAVDIVEQVARTIMDISLTNASRSRLEAEMVIPVPQGAVLLGFDFHGQGAEPSAVLLPREQARRLYDEIVAKTRDPAILEFVGHQLVRSSVFPVEPGGWQKIRLTYEHLLAVDGNRVDYELPWTESVAYQVPWNVSVQIKSKRPLATVYSPSHSLEYGTGKGRSMRVRTTPQASLQPGSFRLSYLWQEAGVSASLMAYPDPKSGGGYFLLLAGTPAQPADLGETLKREVTLVIDRSGSMRGEKLKQVRESALQVLAGLEEGEAFNIIIYSEVVESFSPKPVLVTEKNLTAARQFLEAIRVRGGTNLHDALVEALRPEPLKGYLPIVLFLTDGLPTIGQTSEKAIRKLATEANPYERRVFTIGVGVDVNTPLLDRIATDSRATASFVIPGEDVEVKVAQIFKRLSGPVLAGPEIRLIDREGQSVPGRVMDLIPGRLPDLFENDQMVLLGRYVGDEPLRFELAGNFFGQERTFRFKFKLNRATTRNAFIPRLWASRKIATLTDAIRDRGADASWTGAATTGVTPSDPKIRELVDEIVALSKEFGILTEYTAFLAREGTDLNRPGLLLEEATRNYTEKAIQKRWGYASVNQSLNTIEQRSQSCLNVRNGFLDENLNRVSISTVQQVNDQAFYKRGNRWIDGQLVDRPEAPDEEVGVGSEAFEKLVDRLSQDHRLGCLALSGEFLIRLDGRTILVKLPSP